MSEYLRNVPTTLSPNTDLELDQAALDEIILEIEDQGQSMEGISPTDVSKGVWKWIGKKLGI